MTNSQQNRPSTPEEDIKVLYGRVAKLNDIVSALLSPAWGSEAGIIPADHPLYVGEQAPGSDAAEPDRQIDEPQRSDAGDLARVDAVSSRLRKDLVACLADYPVAAWTPDNIAGRVMRVMQPELDRLSTAEHWESETKRWLAFIERGLTTHMQFSVIKPEGGTEQLPCADWCYACRIEEAEAFKVAVAEVIAEHEGDEWASHSATTALRALFAEPSAAPATEGAALREQVRSALDLAYEATVQRVIDLYERWSLASPPLGQSMTGYFQWWREHLAELHDAILPPTPKGCRCHNGDELCSGCRRCPDICHGCDGPEYQTTNQPKEQ